MLSMMRVLGISGTNPPRSLGSFALPAPRQHRGCRWLDRDRVEGRLPLFQDFAHAGDRPAGPDARDQDVDLPIRIVPELVGGGAAMDVGVRRVLELLRDERVRRPARNLLGFRDGAPHALLRRGQLELRTEQPQQHSPLLRHRLRHGENQLIAARGRHER
jgi:hypothetical protein